MTVTEFNIYDYDDDTVEIAFSYEGISVQFTVDKDVFANAIRDSFDVEVE